MRKITILIFAAALILPSSLFSQISIKLGPVVGLTVPSADYGGDTKDFYAGTSYGLSSGIHFGAVVKVGILSFNGRLSVTYAKLKNDGVADPTANNSTVEVDQSMVVVSVGPEFGFSLPKSPIKPYAGIDLLYSSVSGTFRFQGTSEVSSSEQTIKSASRTGIGFAVGSEIKLGKLNFDLSFRYNLHNLLGKEFIAYSNEDRNNAYINLNDEKDPNYSASNSKHPVGNDRTISTIQVQLGVLFGF